MFQQIEDEDPSMNAKFDETVAVAFMSHRRQPPVEQIFSILEALLRLGPNPWADNAREVFEANRDYFTDMFVDAYKTGKYGPVRRLGLYLS